MAARNTVGFQLTGAPKKATQGVELMPPSKFETSKVSDPWKELASATNEIMCLKQQVDMHKHQQAMFPGSGDGSDLLNRTTTDQYQKKSVEKVGRLEDELTRREAEYHRQLVKLEGEVKVLQQVQSDKVGELEKTYRSEQDELRTELNGVSEALQEKCVELEELQQVHQRVVQQAQTNDREKSSALDQCQNQLSQLKKYISESEEVANSTYVWHKHTEQLKQQLKDVEAEKVNLQSGVQLLNIRLKSQMDIQRLQEQQITQGPDKKKQSQLLQRWREKVFELLVQLESSQITYHKDLTQWNYRYESTEEQLQTEKQENEVLRHYLKDKEAQIQLNESKIKVLESELSRAEQLALHLDNKCREHQTTALNLCDFANSIYEKFMSAEKPVKEVHSKLDSLNQRISFATGRVEMLQSQFLRKEALLKMQIEDRNKEHLTEIGNPQNDKRLNVEEVVAELERVQQERDQLASQIKQDALTLHHRVQAAHQQVSEKVDNLKSENTELQQQLEDKDKELQTLLSKVECQEKEAGNKQTGSSSAEKLVMNTEQTTLLQVELSQARKEQSKALVMVRQMERQLERERNKSQTDFQRMEFYYKQQIVQLEDRVSTLNTDRNILVTNCQQEGLMGKHKREPPAEGTADAIEELKHLSEEILQDSDDMSVDDNQL